MPNSVQVASGSTMNGWFGGFKLHYNFQSLQLLGEAPCADEKATEECPAGIQKLTENNDYPRGQIFNFDIAGLH